MSFNTQTKDLTFTCESKFPVEGNEVDIIVTVDLKHQSDSFFTKTFGGHITINDLQFDLIFSQDPSTKTFIAAYHDPDGKPAKIDDLVKKVCEKAPTTGFEFTLKDALLAYHSQTDNKKTESKWLFGLDIEVGLNLSNLKLPDLPLVGQAFPADQTLKLVFQA